MGGGVPQGLLNPIPVRTIDSRPNAAKIAKKHVTPKIEEQLRVWLREQLDAWATPDPAQGHPRHWVYDLWQRMAAEFGAELTCLTMLRHPAQVVRSRDTAYLADKGRQFRRERETTNVAAWINAAFETERVTRGNARAFVRYPDLSGDWRAAMMRAGKQLGLTYDGDLSGHHPVDDFIDSSLSGPSPTGTASR